MVQVLERILWAHSFLYSYPDSLLNPFQSLHRNCAYQSLQFPSWCYIQWSFLSAQITWFIRWLDLTQWITLSDLELCPHSPLSLWVASSPPSSFSLQSLMLEGSWNQWSGFCYKLPRGSYPVSGLSASSLWYWVPSGLLYFRSPPWTLHLHIQPWYPHWVEKAISNSTRPFFSALHPPNPNPSTSHCHHSVNKWQL